MARRRRRGFTLIELMIVLAIMAILVNTTWINYQRFVQRSKRAEAYLVLEKIYDSQIAFWGTRSRYTTSFQELGLELSGGAGLIAPSVLQGKFYTFTLTQPWGPDSFYAVASYENGDGDAWPDVLVTYSFSPFYQN